MAVSLRRAYYLIAHVQIRPSAIEEVLTAVVKINYRPLKEGF
jgi:hypothetical protein